MDVNSYFFYPLNFLEIGLLVLLVATNIGTAICGIATQWKMHPMKISVTISTAVRGLVVLAGLLSFGIATLWLALYIMVVGTVMENVSMRTGFPFGRYHYNKEGLAPRIGGMPVHIMVEWMIVAIPTWALLSLLNLPVPLFVLLSALVITGWDFFYDHPLVGMGMWIWSDQHKSFKGIPYVNYLGWFFTGIVLSIGATFLPPSLFSAPSVLPVTYLIMLIMQLGLQFFIPHLRPYLAFSIGLWVIAAPLLALVVLSQGLSFTPFFVLILIQAVVWFVTRRTS